MIGPEIFPGAVVLGPRPPEPPWAWAFVALVLGIGIGWKVFLY